jgi:thioredoxin 1
MIPTIDESNFSQEVEHAPVPVLVNFWAPWCGLCRIVNPLLNRFQGEYGNLCKIVTVNADENLKLANAVRLKTLPTLLLFQDGEILHRVDHFTSHDELREAFTQLGDVVETVINQYSYTA